MNSLKVVIADDNEKIVDVIKEVINDEPDMEVVGTAANGEETINIIKNTSPDVVLLDIIMPQLDGISVMQRIRDDKTCDLACIYRHKCSWNGGCHRGCI